MPRAKVKGTPVYVVVRRAWEAHEDGCEHLEDGGGVPVKAFADRAAAEAFRRELEREARRLGPPAQFVYEFDPESVSRKSEDAVRRGLKKLGVPAPPEDAEDWSRWWDQVAPTLTDEQFDGVWDLFDEIKFYDVVETGLED